VRTVFSPSPIHLLVRDDALMLKKVPPTWCEMAFPMSVLPTGGIRRSGLLVREREGERTPAGEGRKRIE
jgi:hypothetical protein